MNLCQDASLAECVTPNELEPQELVAGTDNPQTMYSYHPEVFQTFREKVWKAKHNWIWHRWDMNAASTQAVKGIPRNMVLMLSRSKLMARGIDEGLIIKVLFSLLFISKVWSQTSQFLLSVAAHENWRKGKEYTCSVIGENWIQGWSWRSWSM